MKAGAEQVGAATIESVPCYSIAKPLIRKDPIRSTARVFSFVTFNIRYGTLTGLYLMDTTAIPLYQIGVLPGLSVLAYTIALGVIRSHRNHA
ncbi:hypothetical protein [Burkholderia ubonensis]|uniref:hypothetical protein n=1 Tax=Burkholderia ubonensis TaxID=101571 RepID=UPI000F56389E|nr:hypothetical protein [Burkholderia ubonensis]RQP85247.1 hypothetical protein DF014_12985 [Burkholderia ubonensis]